MTVHIMSNPQSFVREAKLQNVTLELLQEAIECVGKQKLARMFTGNSSRGKLNSASSANLENWVATLEYAKENPDKEDSDPYQARKILPTQEWHDYVTLIQEPIDDDIVESWTKCSNKKLGDEAEKYGITLGIRNGKAIKILCKRMLDMVERRKQNLWLKEEENIIEVEKKDYRLTNVPELRRICKERNLQNAHITTKAELIELLEKNLFNAVYETHNKNLYNMTLPELKTLSKERDIDFTGLDKQSLISNFAKTL